MTKPNWLCELLFYVGSATAIIPPYVLLFTKGSPSGIDLQAQIAGIGMLITAGIMRFEQLLDKPDKSDE